MEENLELGIIGVEDGKRKDEEAVENNEWWVIIRLQVRIYVINVSIFNM